MPDGHRSLVSDLLQQRQSMIPQSRLRQPLPGFSEQRTTSRFSIQERSVCHPGASSTSTGSSRADSTHKHSGHAWRWDEPLYPHLLPRSRTREKGVTVFPRWVCHTSMLARYIVCPPDERAVLPSPPAPLPHTGEGCHGLPPLGVPGGAVIVRPAQQVEAIPPALKPARGSGGSRSSPAGCAGGRGYCATSTAGRSNSARPETRTRERRVAAVPRWVCRRSRLLCDQHSRSKQSCPP
ncbi:MAG: hypothetical protein KatS3mg058_3598 [Roseiflexus sp.]|nr:MAG: hypothetical protein KatS3mg058_3598 [Roseiflexus sp.]